MTYSPNNTISADVLIIGSGGAGLRAAIELHDLGKDVLLIGKSKLRDPHTVLAAGGINAVLKTMDKQDSIKTHIEDTLREGWFINDAKLVELLCKNAPRAIHELESWGMRFHKEPNGRLTQRFFGAHRYRRTCFFGDKTGQEIIRVLADAFEKRKIRRIEEGYVAKIIKDNDNKGKVCGAVILDKKNKLRIIKVNAVILATGGYSKCFSRSSSRVQENHGDGILLALDAGAEVMDMEQVQFHPTGMVWPKDMIGTLVSEAVRGEGGQLFNKDHERFMTRYDKKRMELGPRDEVSRAIYSEILAGRGTKNGGVYLDISSRPAPYLKSRLFGVYKTYKDLGIDISKHPMEIAPTAHYTMGGIRINPLTLQTSVPGLYAIGEVAAGVHGANRLGGNSLAGIMVFGRLVGQAVARDLNHLKPTTEPPNDTETRSLLAQTKGSDPNALMRDVQKMMWEHAGVFRDAKRLKTGIQKLAKAKQAFKECRAGSDIRSYLDLKAVLLASECILTSALARTESRGAHARDDYPKRDDKKWLANLVIKKSKSGDLKITKVPIPKTKVIANAAKYHALE